MLINELGGNWHTNALAVLHFSVLPTFQVSSSIPDLAPAGLKSFERQLRFLARLGREGVGKKRLLLAPQSGALRINAYRDFLPSIHPIPTTYSFRAFKPFNGDLKQP